MKRKKYFDIIILISTMLLLILFDLATKQIAALFLHNKYMFFESTNWKTGLHFVVNSSNFSISLMQLFLCNFMAVIVMWMLRPKLGSDWLLIATFMVVTYAGAWGNYIDFIMRDGVVDFLMLHFEYGTTATQSIFNFADIYIVLGISMIFGLNIVRWFRLIIKY